MAPETFYFALEFSSRAVSASLLGDVARQVLGHVGCSRHDLPELAGALEQAAGNGNGTERRCDVQFRAHNGTLEILVSSEDGRIFQTSQSIP